MINTIKNKNTPKDTKTQRKMLDSCIIIIDTFTNTPIYRIESITKFKKNKKTPLKILELLQSCLIFVRKKLTDILKTLV